MTLHEKAKKGLLKGDEFTIDLLNQKDDNGITVLRTAILFNTIAKIPAHLITKEALDEKHQGNSTAWHDMKNDEIALVVNTVQEKVSAIRDSYQIRREALTDQIPTYTTLAGARAAALGLAGMRELVPYAIQTLHEALHREGQSDRARATIRGTAP